MDALLTPREQRRQHAPAYSPSDEDRAALKILERRFRPNDPVRLRNEQQWDLNRAFLAGLQYVAFDPFSRQLGVAHTQSPRWRSRMPHNMCRPYIRQAVSTLGNFRPRFKGRPKSSDPEDLQAANVAEKVATHYWDFLDMPSKKWEILYWLKVCGNAFFYGYWDPEGGEPLYEPGSVAGEDGQPVDVIDLVFEGEMETEVISPYCVFGDENASTPSEWHYWIDARARTREWLEQHFPDKANMVPEGIVGAGDFSQRRWFVQRTSMFGPQDQSSESWRDWVFVRRMTECPSRDYPKGRLIIECNGVILVNGDNPHPRGRLGLIWVRNEMVPGVLWAQGDMEDMLPLQRSYNRAVNKEIEHVVLTANAKLLEHSGSELSETGPSTEVGERIRWTGQIPPDWLPPPPLPTSITDLKGTILQDFDRVNSTYGAERGQYQGKISGKAYISLIEQGIQTKGPVIERLAIAFAQWARDLLEWVQEYVIENRLIKIVGRANQFDVIEFQGADLHGNTDVAIDVDSMMPKSKALGLELLNALAPGQSWLNAGNPEDRVRVWRMLGLEDENRLVQDKNDALRQAMIENRMMMLGKVIPPAQAEEDQEVHAFAHAELKNSDEYKLAQPIIRAIVDAHIYSHNMLNMPVAGVTVPMTQEETVLEGPEPPARGGGRESGPPQRRERRQMQPFS